MTMTVDLIIFLWQRSGRWSTIPCLRFCTIFVNYLFMTKQIITITQQVVQALYLPLLESDLHNTMPMFVSILLRRACDYGEQILISEGTLAAQNNA